MNTFLGYPVTKKQFIDDAVLREPIILAELIPALPPCVRCGKQAVITVTLRDDDGVETQRGEPLFSCQECLTEALEK